MLFDKLWAQVKGAERSGTLTVEEALDCATRLPQALFCSMMECLAENGEDPQVLVVQVARLPRSHPRPPSGGCHEPAGARSGWWAPLTNLRLESP
jgi:hypothetical protein